LLFGHRAGNDERLAAFQAWSWEVQHLGRLHVGERAEELLQLRKVREPGEPASRTQAGAVRRLCCGVSYAANERFVSVFSAFFFITSQHN
jgi:hypothetical protein